MKVTTGVSLQLCAPEFFRDAAFIEWLNNGDPKMSWHKGGRPDEWSDTVVMVDPSLNGEGPDSDMPEHIWNQIIEACRKELDGRIDHKGLHVLVWVTNIES